MRVLVLAIVLAGCAAPPPQVPLWAQAQVDVAVHAVPGITPDAEALAHMARELAVLLEVRVQVAPVQTMGALPALDGDAVFERHQALAPHADLHVLYVDVTPEADALVWVLHDAPVVVVGHRAVQETARATEDLDAPASAAALERAALLHGAGHVVGLTPCEAGPWCERSDLASVMTWQVANRIGRLDAARHGMLLPDRFDAVDHAALRALRSGQAS